MDQQYSVKLVNMTLYHNYVIYYNYYGILRSYLF